MKTSGGTQRGEAASSTGKVPNNSVMLAKEGCGIIQLFVVV